MKKFQEFLNESITIQSAGDLENLCQGAKKINKDTLVMSNPTKHLKMLQDKLKKWGYKMTQTEDGMTWTKGKSTIGITFDDAKTKATIVVS